ncbi:FAD-dependent monooxygenase [Streptomyces sp. NBC_01335]|uniref:FAD-dependent monooxygenase n=1 Tax=Streptomyces sp. NBC_01335 TaxID=2903828 RepID=UPI002E13E50A|nr:FAD-dependent monooxygenase [Streptomyces sp. NBC_01335]
MERTPGGLRGTGETVVRTDVLIVGAGPVGLTAALELRRRGVACRVIDRLRAPVPHAKAVGIQPRTFELWDRAGVIDDALDAAVPMRGQLAYVNGEERGRIDLELPPDVPYTFAALPQYETERILTEHLERHGTHVERGTELVTFVQDDGGVWSTVLTASGATRDIRSRYLVGCDGAHSAVRKGLGLTFEGGALAEEYMLADVETDWSMPPGYSVRSTHLGDDGIPDDLLICIPLPGRSRYRMSMLVPPELSTAAGPPGRIAHGAQEGPHPELAHIQAVVDRLAPEPATVSQMRWSSVFRISHRIVDRYGEGRVFVAGDAAHIHPPTGAQGMNTGIQDAVNLAWKLALATAGLTAPALLESYDAERRPVGEEVVGRTVRHATGGGVQAGSADPAHVMMREAQLLVGYRDGPLTGALSGVSDAPDSGDRAPDCGGLVGPLATYPVRLFDLLRRGPDHTLVLYGPDTAALDRFGGAVAEMSRRTHGRVPIVAVLGSGGRVDGNTRVPVWSDSGAEFRRMYRTDGPTGFLVRPDGYLALRLGPDAVPELSAYLSRVLRT